MAHLTPSTDSPLVAIIGCGRHSGTKEGWAIGHAHAKGWRDAAPGVRLIGVDPSSENLSAFGRAFGLPDNALFSSTEELYAAHTPDYVSVCTWPRLHAPQVIDAAARGVKGIVCEKPVATSPGEIQELLAACEDRGTRLAIAHQRVFEPRWQAARQAIRNGVLGGGLVLEFRVGDNWDMLSWTVHWFAMANFLFDATPTSILAGMDHTGGRRYHHAVENQSIVFAEYAGGRQAVFITGPEALGGETATIRGELGFMRVKEDSELFTRDGYQTPAVPDTLPPSWDFAPIMAELLLAVRTGCPMVLDARQTAHATNMAYAAHESARLGRKIRFPIDFQYAPLEIVQHSAASLVRGRRVVLFADEHFGSFGNEGIAEALQDITGEDPVVVDAAKAGLTEESVVGAHAIAIFHTQATADETTKRVLEAWVNAGKPLLLLHCAVGAYPDWDAFKQWAGRVWVWSGPDASEHPHVESTLKALPNAPVSWQSAWLPKDEVFIKLASTSPTEDLLNVEIDQGTFPAAWRCVAHRNILVWIPGHRRDFWRLPVLRDALRTLLSLNPQSSPVLPS